MAGRAVRIYRVPAGEVDRLFEEGGQLFGFSRSRLTPTQIASRRAQVLYEALGREDDVALGILPDGRLVALDYLVSNPYRFAVEEND